MGNLPSHVAGDDDLVDFELEKATQKAEDQDREENLFDFSILTNIEALHKAIASLKELPTSEIQRKKSDIKQWLKGLSDRGEKTIGIAQFVDFLTSKSISREEAVEFFNELDPDGDGNIEVTFVLQMLKDKKDQDLKGALVPCNMLPGYVDIYLTERSSVYPTNLGLEITKFLRRHRVDSSHLSSSVALSQMSNILESRERLANGRFFSFKEKREDKISLEDQENGEEEESHSKVLVSKCYSSIAVSSNERTATNLTDNSMETYWQSNGSPRTHWIRVQMLSGIRLKNFSVGLSTSDDSYMPKTIAVSVGNSPSNLKEIKQYSIPREFTGKFTLLGSLCAEYRYIQLNIRGCHSDGCDTRIRQIYVQGYRYKRENLPTVMDGLVIFYLNLISSVVTTAIPLTPSLRDTILGHSKNCFRYLPPLSLSRTSTQKPEFLSTTLTNEMDKFIKTLCLPGDNFVSVDTESLAILIEFSVITGNFNNILDSLQILMDNVVLDLELCPLMMKLESLEIAKFKRHASLLRFDVVKCDAETVEGHQVNNMFTNEMAGTGVPFKTVKGKNVVNIIVKGKKSVSWLQVVKIHMKVSSGDTGAKAGLLFLLDVEDPKDPSILEKYEQYDTFTADDWNKLSEIDKMSGKGPVAYFAPEKEWKEAELTIEGTLPPTKYLLLKFLSQESSDQIAVQCIKIKGYEISEQLYKSNELLRNMVLKLGIPTDPMLPFQGSKVLLRILIFLCHMLHDLGIIHTSRTNAYLDPETFEESHVSTESLSLEKIWSLYVPLSLSGDSLMEQCTLVTLLLIRRSIPFLKATPTNKLTKGSNNGTNNNETKSEGGAVNDGDTPSSIPSAVLSHLCSLMDNPDTDPFVRTLAQDIIKAGVVVFFPGSRARRGYLLEMVKLVLTGEQPASWWLKFEALCGYFSKTNTNSLLELSYDLPKVGETDPNAVMEILKTIITVASTEAANDLSEGARSHPDDLVRLLCAMQSNLFYWIRFQLTLSKEMEEQEWNKIKGIVHKLLTNYVGEIFSNCHSLLKKVETLKTIEESVLEALRRSLVGQALPEMLTFLSTLLSEDIPVISLLNTLSPLIALLHSLSQKLPHVFLSLGSEELQCSEERELAVWTRESRHNYENNSKINEEFVCPGAERFLIEFDSRCCTERRYDYLQFTDSTGEKKTFDDTYGSDHWPSSYEFKGPKLSFYFYSDGSNNFWGYRFTIKAYGKGFPPLHWLFDLQINLSRTFGLAISNVLGTKKSSLTPVKGSSNKEEEKKEMEALLRSNFWKTLLRGGYQVGKLTRSLSGAHATSPTDSNLYSYLYEMAEEEETIHPLIEICRTTKGGPFFGGGLVDRAVSAVFASLIWHSQELREELTANLSSPKASHGILDAFVAAESLRRELVEARQKLVEAKENEKEANSHTNIDEDQPVNACREKAFYLLKFAGLSRVSSSSSTSLVSGGGSSGTLADDRPGSPVIRRPSWGQKHSRRWQRVSSVVSTVSHIKQQVSREGRGLSLAEKHPSFDTVLSFVRNSVLTKDKIHELIQNRSKLAKELSDAYNIAAEFFRVMAQSGAIEIPLLVFLQSLLICQRKFPLHYGLRLDGCGLELETQLRRSFQIFIHRLLDIINAHKKAIDQLSTDPQDGEGVEMVKCVFSHLLDMSWQDYDHLLLREIELPDYLFNIVINSSSSEDKTILSSFVNEKDMMTRYNHHMKLLELWKTIKDDSDKKDDEKLSNFKETELAKENPKETLLFLAMLAGSPTVGGVATPLCDGCKLVLDNENKIWYRNMEIEENLNLCKECFFDGTGERPDSHTHEQEFQQFCSYTCTDCGLSIISHRFLNKTDNKNYCIGCFRKIESTVKEWTVFLLEEHKATEKANKYFTHHDVKSYRYYDSSIINLHEASSASFYNQHHSWTLFSSLALSMAHNLSSEDKSKTVSDPPYQRYACEILLTCLELVATGLKFSLAAAMDEQIENKKGDELPKEETKPDKEEDKNDDSSQLGPVDPRVQTDAPMDNPTKTTPTTTATPTETKDTVKEATPKDESKDTVTDDTKQVTEPAAAITGNETEPKEEGKKEEKPLEASEGYLGRPMTGVERSFGKLFTNKCLGLLASVLPKELTLQSWISMNGNVERVLADTVLPVLLQLAGSKAIGEARQLQSILVATQFMARVSTEVADRAIEVLQGVALDPDSERVKTHGEKTTQFLFQLGADHLQNSNISGAATVAECLLLLSKSNEWKATVAMTIGSVLDVPPDSITLPGIFGLLVIAGFPKLLREGSIVKWSKHDEELRGVVVAPPTFEDKNISVVEIKSRETVTIKQGDFEVEEMLSGCIMDTKLQQLISLLSSVFSLTDKTSPRQVENCWILSLVLKSLSVLLNSNNSDIVKTVLKASILPDIVRLACKPTQLNSHWNLSDLEVISISCYKPAPPTPPPAVEDDKPPTEPAEEVDGSAVKKDNESQKEEEKDDKEQDESKPLSLEPPEEKETSSPPPPPKSQKELEEEAALRGLSSEVQGTLKIMKEAFQCTFAVVRAMYEIAGEDMDKFIMSSERFYDTDSDCLKVPDEIKEEAKKWGVYQKSLSIKETIQEYQDSQEDMGVTGFLSVDVDLKNITAAREDEDELKKSMILIPKDKDKKKSKVSRQEKSHELLQEHLKKLKEEGEGTTPDRDFMLKVKKALMVLQSRQVLGSLLLQWPRDGPRINALQLGSLDTTRWFSLLDFLLKGLPEQTQDKVLYNVVVCSETTELISLALTAVQCMTDVVVSSEEKIIQYSTENETKEEGKVVVSNAAFLRLEMEVCRSLHGSVTLHAKDSSEYNYYEEQDKKIKGDEKEKKFDQKIPGNTVHYNVCLRKQEEDSPCHSFAMKITGLQLRRFDTSYALLRILLNNTSPDLSPPLSPPSSPLFTLPLVKLWPKLIAAACELTGEQRLKVVGLLLQFLHLSSSGSVPEHRLDLTLLKPLWSLYTSITKQEDKPDKMGSLKPEITRGLTELFLIVENLAQKWDMEQDLMLETVSEDSILKWFEKGVSNIAYLSLGLGLTNRVSDAFVEAKKNYVPPPPPVPSQSDQRSGSPDTSDDDDDDEDDEDFSSSSSSSNSSSDSSFESE